MLRMKLSLKRGRRGGGDIKTRIKLKGRFAGAHGSLAMRRLKLTTIVLICLLM